MNTEIDFHNVVLQYNCRRFIKFIIKWVQEGSGRLHSKIFSGDSFSHNYLYNNEEQNAKSLNMIVSKTAWEKS